MLSQPDALLENPLEDHLEPSCEGTISWLTTEIQYFVIFELTNTLYILLFEQNCCCDAQHFKLEKWKYCMNKLVYRAVVY